MFTPCPEVGLGPYNELDEPVTNSMLRSAIVLGYGLW